MRIRTRSGRALTVVVSVVIAIAVLLLIYAAPGVPTGLATILPTPRAQTAPVAPAGQLDDLSPLQRALGQYRPSFVLDQPASISKPSRVLDICTVPHAVSHRGGSETNTENTLKAFDESYKLGLDEWETDIRFDAADKPVVMHDATIDRTTTGTGNVTAITFSSSSVTMNDGQLLANQTLDKLLAQAAARGATLAIEPKVLPTAWQVSQVVTLINAHDMRDRVLIDSFEVSHLEPFKAVAPDLAYSLVTSTAVTPAVAAAVGPILNIKADALTQQLVDDYHAAGVAVYAWTLDTPSAWAPQRTWDIDRYVTNRPMAYRGWRDWVCTNEKWEGSY